MRIYLTSLGCKLNQAESETLARQALAAGHAVVQDPAQADWAVVNTCAVTQAAARKSRQAVRGLRRRNPAIRVAVIGCYAEISPDEAAALAGVELVLPNARKEEALAQLLSLAGEEGWRDALPPGERLAGGRTRAFIKIQDGCDNCCAYCIVTVARGPSRSRPAEAVLAEAQQRLSEGYREIVLTGVNIGAYGRDRVTDCDLDDVYDLAALARELLELPGLLRLRLSSVEPWDVTPVLLALWPHPRLCRHLHLPLQSGSDAVLRRMGRGYTAEEYREVVRALRQHTPLLGLSTDVIVGFPGETDADFAQTLALARACAFSRLHVFRFSPRAGTSAATMPNPVPSQVAQARSEQLIAIGQELAAAFHRQHLGAEMDVLLESAVARNGAQTWDGLTDNYIRVGVASSDDLSNRCVRVRLVAADAQGLRGVIV
jgi:threonylcarbamoyladenosine tRNA methylthiotransferase MtaB